MAEKTVLLLGDPRLYKLCEPIREDQLPLAETVMTDLHDTMMAFRKRFGFGRAIAAPQIDAPYRIIYLNVGEPEALINPELVFPDDERMEMWDDCMSFPGLEVWLQRYKRCVVRYRNLKWEQCEMALEGDLSELIQHEYDHLDGILAVQRAKDLKAFRFNPDKA